MYSIYIAYGYPTATYALLLLNYNYKIKRNCLSWNEHINYITSKANNVKCFLQHNLSQCPTHIKAIVIRAWYILSWNMLALYELLIHKRIYQ